MATRGPSRPKPTMTGRRQARSGPPAGHEDGPVWYYGHHAVAAALDNPLRPCIRLLTTKSAQEKLGRLVERPGLVVEEVQPARLNALLGEEPIHQGVALEVGPLPPRPLDSLLAGLPPQAILLALDEIGDPRNLGAILRSAAAMDVAGVIMPSRRTAPLGAACAKAASGAVDIVPLVEVVNLSQALVSLKDAGFWIVGLEATADTALEQVPHADRRVLVLGGEGRGLRRLVAESCDLLARLPIAARIESLNVSVAAGIALYELAREQRRKSSAAGFAG